MYKPSDLVDVLLVWSNINFVQELNIVDDIVKHFIWLN